ncbi:hypothetical protein SNEBB_009385 [Seison nebaliae]|nr:hypothetical protein SNEBB_009385 [Seison nebaliae]
MTEVLQLAIIKKWSKIRSEVDRLGEDFDLASNQNNENIIHLSIQNHQEEILKYLIENSYVQREDLEMPTGFSMSAIHYAASCGNNEALSILLDANVDVNQQDSNGITAIMITAKNGNTTGTCLLLAKRANLNVLDVNYDSALHLAAFRGKAEIIELLLFAGSTQMYGDRFQQNPLHLAVASNNLNSVWSIIRNVEIRERNRLLSEKDSRNMTPKEFAIFRRFTEIERFLDRMEPDKNKQIQDKIIHFLYVKTRSATTVACLLILFWLYPFYFYNFYNCFSIWTNHLPFILLQFSNFYHLYKGAWMDPGFVPTNSPEYHGILNEIKTFKSSSKQILNSLKFLCQTCRSLKPIRSKHCSVCNRCVVHFDHHCPIFSNCVGYYNRINFLWFAGGSAFTAVYLMYCLNRYVHKHGWLSITFLITLVVVCIFSIVIIVVSIRMMMGIFSNLSTNEQENMGRYFYFRIKDKNRLLNPFNHSIISNIQEFFHLKKPSKYTLYDSFVLAVQNNRLHCEDKWIIPQELLQDSKSSFKTMETI